MGDWHEERIRLPEQGNRTIDALQQGSQLLLDEAEEVEEGEFLVVNDRVCRVMEARPWTHEGESFLRLLVRKSSVGGSFDGGELPQG